MHAGDLAATFCATLVDQWIDAGLRHAVICPGSRSTPMALALASRPELAVHVVLDERSAGFAALGIGAATGRPAVVLTTSGTAAVELHPAVVEADLQGVPLLVVTANRPPELQGVGAPQTIDQRELYGRSVRWFCEPGPPEESGRPFWRQLATDCVAATSGEPPGPVQLDLAFREPLLGDVGELPASSPGRPVDRPTFGLLDEQLGRLADLLGHRRVVLVAGARAARSEDDRDALLGLAQSAGWPVLCDHLSRLRVEHPSVVTTFDPVLRSSAGDGLRPDVVVRVGGLLASRVTNEWLLASGAAQVGLDRFGVCPHPGFEWAAEYRVDPGESARQLTALLAGRGSPSEFSAAWAAAERSAVAAVRATRLGEPAVLDTALRAVPPGGALVVSSSMPVRDLEWYGSASLATVLSNRGANGIDGVVSTAVGVASSGRPTIAVVGDLAMLHDSSALVGLADRPVDLAIVVIDNDGGGIFSFLPQADNLDHNRFEQLFGTPQHADLVGLARAHRLHSDRLVVAEPADAGPALASALSQWSRDGGVQVLVVPSDRAANVEVHRRINAAVQAAVTVG